MAMPDGMLTAVRNYLDITWADAEGDTKLTGIIGRGIAYIDRIAGRAQDYTVPGSAQALLYDYCRYARSNALEDYQRNFLHELNALQLSEGVAMFAEAAAAEAAADV